MELGERKKAILRAIIESYIETGEPIGSKLLCQKLDNAVSSATIRNEMADLASLGLLDQPHTSAGRVPTAKAFRLYIDKLMRRQPLEQDGKDAIERRLTRAAGDPERLLGEATQMLSDVTGCAALTTPPVDRSGTLRRVQLVRMSDRTLMLAVMTSSGVLRSRLCRVDALLTDEQLQAFAEILANRFVGQPLSIVTPAKMQEMMSGVENGLLMASVLTGFYELVQESVESDVRLTGQLSLLGNPDYQWENARLLLGFLSRRERLSAMLAAYTSGLHVLLGSESLCPELRGSSVIVTRYSPDGRQSGALGLIGPVRMDYARTIPQMEYMAKTMERLLAEMW